MLHNSPAWGAAFWVAWCGLAVVQDLLPIRAPVKRARYDAAAHQVLRSPNDAVGSTAPVVYDNTCRALYYAGLRSATQTGGSQSMAIVDHGRIPGPGSAQTSFVLPGCAESYAIDELTIAYCTTSGRPAEVVMNWWYPVMSVCGSSPFFDGSPRLAELRWTGLPGGGTAGSPACYLVDIVNIGGLTIPGSDVGFARFGWSIQMPNTSGGDGPFAAGTFVSNPCAPGDGTIWDTEQPTPEEGSGVGNPDLAWFEVFGGEPSIGCGLTYDWIGFYLELRSSGACSGVAPFCFGNAWDCPCANAGQPGRGCESAALTGGVELGASGYQPDGAGGGVATLAGAGFPPAAFPAVVAIRAPDPEHPPLPFGDGLRCVGTAGLVRVGAALAQGGAVAIPLSHGAGAGIFSYQLWYRSNPASYCTPSGFNLSNGLQLTW